jgi:hypothetical protein
MVLKFSGEGNEAMMISKAFFNREFESGTREYNSLAKRKEDESCRAVIFDVMAWT